MDMRLEHIARSQDKDLHEIRVYTCGVDFTREEAERELPYGTIDGKPKSNDNFFASIIGDKLEDEI